MSNYLPMTACPLCSKLVEVDVQNCGCEQYSCGAVQTCEDYHHGMGVLLPDCLEAFMDAQRTDGVHHE